MSWVCTVIAREQTAADWRTQIVSLLGEYNVSPSQLQVLSPYVQEYGLPSEPSAEFRQKARRITAESHVDIILQPAELSLRHKKLVVFDMDSTLIQNECIDMIAAYVGVEAKVAAITEAAMRGELDFSQSLAERVALLKGVPTNVYDELKRKITITNGARELCTTLRARGVKLAVLSGGFVPLASWLSEQLGLDYFFANNLEEDPDTATLTGRTIGRIVNGEIKAELLVEIAEKEGIDLERVLAVGDGSNDLPMMARAGFGVAFCAKPLVQDRAPAALNTGNLADLLYVLGY